LSTKTEITDQLVTLNCYLTNVDTMNMTTGKLKQETSNMVTV